MIFIIFFGFSIILTYFGFSILLTYKSPAFSIELLVKLSILFNYTLRSPFKLIGLRFYFDSIYFNQNSFFYYLILYLSICIYAKLERLSFLAVSEDSDNLGNYS